jgi:2-keto-4-pentenoate hydratase/2-oxohepta-3-ene-1,7-dioic acid hydratase in catechol pathway
MVRRYVRVQAQTGDVYYGILQPNRSVDVLDAPPWLQGQPTEVELVADTYQLLAPCTPSKIIAVGRNYAAHAAEMQSAVPREPLLFLKPPTTVIPCHTAIGYPTQTQRVDYEGELALIMGEACVNCSPHEAQQKIWGYTIANDVTARDLQQTDGQWTRAKGFDTFCPLGPWIVQDLSPSAKLQTFLNEQLVQSVSIQDMTFSPQELVSYISQVMTLLPGDVILTGTPAGIGPMQIGDRVRVEIEGIGCLENYVIQRQLRSPETVEAPS